MRLCYIDESGTPDVPGNTSHYVLAGVSIPVWHWKIFDYRICEIKKKYDIEKSEIHVAWILRAYPEQTRIPDFEILSHADRRSHVQSFRTAELLRLQRAGNPNQYKQTRKNYKKTEAYIHLTRTERKSLIKEVAQCLGGWTSARLFAECVDKVHFDPTRTSVTIDEQAFEQIVSRFERYLQIACNSESDCGLLIHDNNETVARKHTELMKKFHRRGTGWTHIDRIIETPLFVNSELTSLVQVSDLCAYALRRYLENDEEELFDIIYERADKKDGKVVGVRHFTNNVCVCKICDSHKTRSGSLMIP